MHSHSRTRATIVGEPSPDQVADRRPQRVVDYLLAHESVCVAVGGHEPVGVLAVGTHQDDLRQWQFLPDAPRQLDPVEAGHHQIRDHDVGLLASHDREGLLAICSLGHDGHRVRQRSKEGADDQAVLLIVVDYDDARARPASRCDTMASDHSCASHVPARAGRRDARLRGCAATGQLVGRSCRAEGSPQGGSSLQQ